MTPAIDTTWATPKLPAPPGRATPGSRVQRAIRTAATPSRATPGSRVQRAIRTAAALTFGALVLGGCGGGTQTVSVASTTPSATSAQRTQTEAPTSSSPSTQTGTTTTATSPAPPAATTQAEATHTATAPAFAKQPTPTEGLTGAVALVKAHGYMVTDTSDYHPEQTLRVLIGARTDGSAEYDQQAFFFVDNRYIGTDSSEPSAIVKVVSQSDTEVALGYALYRPSDSSCCPGGGQATVRFQLDNGQLTALDPIPPASSLKALSRR